MVVPVVGTQLPQDPFQNPLLFLVPALGIFGDAGDAAGAAAADVGVRLAHQPHTQRRADADRPASCAHLQRLHRAVILLVLTLSLSAYTASLAETMDNHTYQQQAYGSAPT